MDANSRNWAMIIHLSVFAGYVVPLAGLLAPIIIWQIKKDEMPAIDAHGRTVANFLISMFIYSIISLILCLVVIGVVGLIVLGIVGIVYPIIGGIKANSGELWSYPGILRLI